MKFKTVEDAINAVKLTNNHVLDKKHTFKVCLYSDLDKYDAVTDEFVPPPQPPFIPRPSVIGWLTDPQCRDQFLLRYSRETEVCWATHLQGEEPSIVYDGSREKLANQNWCESYSQWSPQGTYLATFHNPGIKLWGGDQFELQGRFLHHGVEVIDFSPCENYMVTYVLTAPHDAPDAIIIWDVRTGEKLRSFSLKNPLEPNFMVIYIYLLLYYTIISFNLIILFIYLFRFKLMFLKKNKERKLIVQLEDVLFQLMNLDVIV